jgi:hypothetical protein
MRNRAEVTIDLETLLPLLKGMPVQPVTERAEWTYPGFLPLWWLTRMASNSPGAVAGAPEGANLRPDSPCGPSIPFETGKPRSANNLPRPKV